MIMRGLTRVMRIGFIFGAGSFAIILLGIGVGLSYLYAVGHNDDHGARYAMTPCQVMRSIRIASMSKIKESSLVTRLTSMPLLRSFADSMLKMGVITPLMMVSSVLLTDNQSFL